MSKREAPNPDDPLAYWLEKREATKSAKTLEGDRSAVKHFRDFLSERDLEPGEAHIDDCIGFINHLQDTESLQSDVSSYSYMVKIVKFYEYFSKRGTFETNPMSLAMEEVDPESGYDEQRRDISLEEMREFFSSLGEPREVVTFTFLSKFGIRAGELSNVDLYDINIDHAKANEYLPDPRPEIQDRTDVVYVPSDKEGNKREINTILPLDDEAKQALVYWLAARLQTPDGVEGEPLIQMIDSGGSPKPNGARASRDTITQLVRNRTGENGWYKEGAGRQYNVTPHYFRHWFTTMAERQGIDGDVIDYIRGDKGVKSRKDYRHFWGSEVKDEYRDNIFKLFE